MCLVLLERENHLEALNVYGQETLHALSDRNHRSQAPVTNDLAKKAPSSPWLHGTSQEPAHQGSGQWPANSAGRKLPDHLPDVCRQAHHGQDPKALCGTDADAEEERRSPGPDSGIHVGPSRRNDGTPTIP